jgi:hypothetical protein
MSQLENRLRVEAKRERDLEWCAVERGPDVAGMTTHVYRSTDKRPRDAEVQLMRYMREEMFA